MATEVDEVFKVIRGLLLADNAFLAACPRVYCSDQVPEPATYPYCLIDFTAGTDVDGAGTVRLMTQALMLARLVNKGPVDSNMRDANALMDGILQSTVRKVSGDYVFSMRREKPHRRSYVDTANNRYSETGGFYRAYIAH